jgi:hypothetical protein
MSDKRQKNQLSLAFAEEYRGEARMASVKGPNRSRRSVGQKAGHWRTVIEEVCGRENCKQALARIKANQGSAGVDGMTVHALPEYLKQHWQSGNS